MCGIAGIFTRPQGGLAVCASAMIEPIRHRGPDGAGVWADDAAGVALGHRRLAILDLSAAGNQPMFSARGRWVVVLNGEIYNHREVRALIEERAGPVRWRGHSDTETLVEAIETWGFAEALPKLVGMFAIAAWDREDRCLWLARDRMGEKPLYYGQVGGRFVFASELRAIKAVAEPGDLTVSPAALSLLTTFNYIPGAASIYSEVEKLPPGTLLALRCPDDRSAAPQAYWRFPSRRSVPEEGAADLAAQVDLVDATLRRAVRSQMLADVPLGALLSGGIDSSLIVAMMQRESAKPISTFTIGFEEAGSDESCHAREVARFVGTDHHEMVVSSRVALDQIPSLPALLDEPMADSSQIPTMCVMGLARQHVTVALSGDGADELFGGYGRYRRIGPTWQATRGIPRGLLAIGGALADSSLCDVLALLGGGRGKALLQAARYYLPRLASSHSARDLYLATVMQWRDVDLIRDRGGLALDGIGDLLDRACSSDLASFMMQADALTYLPDDILVKVDRAAMAHSLETRAPFLDPDVVALAARLPLASKLEPHRGKAVLQECLARYLPRALFERPKQGFSVPLDAWLRGPLRDWAEALLDPRRIEGQGYLRPEPITKVWRRHQAGEINAGHQLWSVLVFQAWLEA